MIWNSLYGNYRTRTFCEIFDSTADTFLAEYKANKIGTPISDESATTLFYLLYAKYGNSHIASSDENQFKYKIWMTIYMYGPTWEKRVEIQNKLRGLTDDQLRQSATAIYNHALNPSTAPSTQILDELEYIDEQNVTKHMRSAMDAYSFLLDLLKTDVTGYFLDRFKTLFLTIVEPELPLWYVSDSEED